MTETAPVGAVASLRSDLEDADYQTQLDSARSRESSHRAGVPCHRRQRRRGPTQRRGLRRTPRPRAVGAAEYFKRPEANEQEFEDGYLKTGDVMSVDEDGYIKIVDRAKDVIESGGEWISSLELESS